MNFISIIPARAGSKGVTNKNVIDLRGKPLIAHSIEISKNINRINRTIVTTDSEDYKIIAEKYGAEVILRPEYLSNDTATDTDYLLHAIYTCNLDIKDFIVLLRPTTPLRNIDKMNEAIDYFIKIKSKCRAVDSLKSMHEINEPPEKMYQIVPNELSFDKAIPYIETVGHEKADLPRQCFRKCYIGNGYIDILSISSIVNRKTTYGNIVIPFVTDKVTEVDSEDDFKYLEYLVKNDK